MHILKGFVLIQIFLNYWKHLIDLTLWITGPFGTCMSYQIINFLITHFPVHILDHEESHKKRFTISNYWAVVQRPNESQIPSMNNPR